MSPDADIHHHESQLWPNCINKKTHSTSSNSSINKTENQKLPIEDEEEQHQLACSSSTNTTDSYIADSITVHL